VHISHVRIVYASVLDLDRIPSFGREQLPVLVPRSLARVTRGLPERAAAGHHVALVIDAARPLANHWQLARRPLSASLSVNPVPARLACAAGFSRQATFAWRPNNTLSRRSRRTGRTNYRLPRLALSSRRTSHAVPRIALVALRTNHAFASRSGRSRLAIPTIPHLSDALARSLFQLRVGKPKLGKLLPQRRYFGPHLGKSGIASGSKLPTNMKCKGSKLLSKHIMRRGHRQSVGTPL
jgi:hypothetical protein